MNFELGVALLALFVWAMFCVHTAAESNADTLEIQRLTEWIAWFRTSDGKSDSALQVMLASAERLLTLAKQGKSPRRNIKRARDILFAAFDRI
jgi:hypothetical protein